MKRFPFLDWMRGLAVVIMIQCHTFNSFVRLDLRNDGPYIYSQFIGGMAAPLFLFMAGMTTAFQMESLARREASPLRRWAISLRRAGYTLAIAFAFRITNYLGSLPSGDPHELLRVDILNCMGVAMAVFAAAAVFDSKTRTRVALAVSLAIAAAAPVMAHLDWDGVPSLVREYLVPVTGRGQFPLFPCASYLGFGLVAGVVVKRTVEEHFERLMLWSAALGFVLTFGAHYFANLPYSVYPETSFWADNPSLVLIRVGIMVIMLAASYAWTTYCVGPAWSWLQSLGKSSLMVYWVHVMMVYGGVARPIKRTMSIPVCVASTLLVTVAMLGLAAAWQRWKARRAARQAVRPQMEAIPIPVLNKIEG